MQALRLLNYSTTFSAQDILDHQNMRGEGLDMKPTPIARYSPHTETRDATLNVLPKGLAIADLLDAIVLTYVCYYHLYPGYSG